MARRGCHRNKSWVNTFLKAFNYIQKKKYWQKGECSFLSIATKRKKLNGFSYAGTMKKWLVRMLVSQQPRNLVYCVIQPGCESWSFSIQNKTIICVNAHLSAFMPSEAKYCIRISPPFRWLDPNFIGLHFLLWNCIHFHACLCIHLIITKIEILRWQRIFVNAEGEVWAQEVTVNQ